MRWTPSAWGIPLGISRMVASKNSVASLARSVEVKNSWCRYYGFHARDPGSYVWTSWYLRFNTDRYIAAFIHEGFDLTVSAFSHDRRSGFVHNPTGLEPTREPVE